MIKQLSQDYAFFLTFGLGIVALVISTYNFQVTRTRTSLSEQIRISRELSESIADKFDEILKTEVTIDEDEDEKTERTRGDKPTPDFDRSVLEGIIENLEKLSPYRMGDPEHMPPYRIAKLFSEIDFFSHLVLHDQIKDRIVLDYFLEPIYGMAYHVLTKYITDRQRMNLYSMAKDFVELIMERKSPITPATIPKDLL